VTQQDTGTGTAVEVQNNADEHRYEARLDGALAGIVVYRLEGDRVALVHTEVADEFAGHGVGSALAREALLDVRRQGRQVTPICPFIAAYVEANPEFADLTD